MSRCALICALLLSTNALGYAASPDALWQDYQKNPGYVSNVPTKPAPAATPHVTVETQDGSAAEPTTPEQAKEKAKLQPVEAEAATAAESTSSDAEAEATPDAEAELPAATSADAEATPAAEAEIAATNTAADSHAVQGDASVFDETPAAQPAAATTPAVVSNKPVTPANKPKLNLVGKPPLPKQFMRTPQGSDFTTVTSTSGGYSLALPSAFGADPLASLPQAEGAMLVRTASDTLMCAITVLDAADSTSYSSTQTLPEYENKKLYWHWQQDAALTWDCSLSAHNDYQGDKILLEAQARQAEKTYQMFFVMPKARYLDLLPQAVYALNSFKLN